MKRILFGLLWLAALAVAGAAIGGHVPAHALAMAGLKISTCQLGALAGGLVFFFLAGVNALPGARLRGGSPVEWGWKQAVWMIAQFFTMQAAAQVTLAVLAVLSVPLAARLHVKPPPLGASDLAVWAVVAGYLAAGWWSFWYIGRLGPARLADGSPAGIGWRAAPGQAYLAALACLPVVGAASVVVQHWLPPDKAGQTNLFQQIFGPQDWKIAALFLMAAVVAPFLEELVFRGGMIAALAPRLGAAWAAAITTMVFTACHAEEFATYHAGILVILTVAVLLAWLRLTYGSIRPGILLHILFNGVGVLMMALGR
jgi:membrane protease YdiL (CAAX protease family)